MSFKDIIVTQTLTDAQKFVLASPDVWIASGTDAERKLDATEYKISTCSPEKWNEWIQTFTISFQLTQNIIAVPDNAAQGYVKLKFAQWQNAVSSHIQDGYEASFYAKIVDTIDGQSIPRRVIYQYYSGFNIYTAVSTKVVDQPISFLTGGDVRSGTYPEIRFQNYVAGMYLSANTIFKVVPPSQFSFVNAGSDTTYTEMSFRCNPATPLCTSATAQTA